MIFSTASIEVLMGVTGGHSLKMRLFGYLIGGPSHFWPRNGYEDLQNTQKFS